MNLLFKNLILVIPLCFLGSLSFVIEADAQTRRTPARPVSAPTSQISTPSEADRIFWEEILKQDTNSGYLFYLRERPDGFYAAEARARIAEFEERAEKARWDIAVEGNTKSSFELYLRDRPHGPYAGEARQRIAGFKDREETVKWEIAVEGNTKSSFESFLREHPNGKYVSQAKERIEQFDRAVEDAIWKSAEAEKSEAAYKDYILKYPFGIYTSVARLRLSEMGASFGMRDGIIGSFVKNNIGIELAWVPPGDFMMGSPSTETQRSTAEGPQRLVSIQQGFWMGRFEVTQDQYEAVMGRNPSRFKSCGKNCPVEQVSWNDAMEFIKRLNDMNDGFVYSLPSEAEWEYAARAGSTTAFTYGNSLTSTEANISGNMSKEVGDYDGNEWGLHDMHGNVWEFVHDIYKGDYTSLPTDGSANTTRGDSNYRVLRGGSWHFDSTSARSAYRVRFEPQLESDDVGFRIVAHNRFGSSSEISKSGVANTSESVTTRDDPPPSPIRRGETVGPRIMSLPWATYTEAARQAGIQGKVVLRVTFHSDGSIGAISAVSGLPNGLTERAIAAARSIRFEPAKRNGVPYSVTRTIEYSFTIY